MTPNELIEKIIGTFMQEGRWDYQGTTARDANLHYFMDSNGMAQVRTLAPKACQNKKGSSSLLVKSGSDFDYLILSTDQESRISSFFGPKIQELLDMQAKVWQQAITDHVAAAYES